MIERFEVRSLAATLGIAVAVAGCGNLTAGGFGEAVVVVSADAPASITAVEAALSSRIRSVSVPAHQSGLAAGAPERHDGHEHPEGELQVEFMVYLVSSIGAEVALSEEPVQVEVDLEGVEQDETLPQTVPAADYSQLRMVFLKIEAEVDAGLVINGDTITGPIEVDFEGSLEVRKPIDLSIADTRRSEILIGLNAASWLQAVDPDTGAVDAGVFANLVEITTR